MKSFLRTRSHVRWKDVDNNCSVFSESTALSNGSKQMSSSWNPCQEEYMNMKYDAMAWTKKYTSKSKAKKEAHKFSKLILSNLVFLFVWNGFVSQHLISTARQYVFVDSHSPEHGWYNLVLFQPLPLFLPAHTQCVFCVCVVISHSNSAHNHQVKHHYKL